MGDYTVFDFETSGLDVNADRIIQVGICEICDKTVTCQDGWLVRQEVRIHPKAEAVHGISNRDIDDNGIDPKESLARLFELLKQTPMSVGHNIHRFDVPFMLAEAQRLGIAAPDVDDFIDTAALYKGWKMGLYRSARESHRDYALRVLSMRVYGLRYAIPVCLDELNINESSDEAHDASIDAYLTHLIFEKLLINLEERV